MLTDFHFSIPISIFFILWTKQKKKKMNSTLEASTNSTAVPHYIFSETNTDVCVYAINFMFGVPTHSYIIWLIITGTGNGVASEFFNINLSVCELCFSINCLLITLSYVGLIGNWWQIFLIGITITGRPLFQCLMCVERYLAVVHPVTFLKYKPLRYRVICCTAAWIITLGSCFFCMFIVSSYHYNEFVLSFLIQFLLFLSIQLFFLVAVLRALKQSGPGERGREREVENHMKRRAFYLILIITVSMVVIFFPFIVIGFLTIGTQLNTEHYRSGGLFCFIVGGFVHPFLFLQRTGKLSCVCTS